MDFSRDELRRQRREIDRANRAAEGDHAALVRGLFEDIPVEHRADVVLGVDRRGFFRMGGLAVATTAVLAACREKGPKDQIPISGKSPGYRSAADKPVTDSVLLRTASSLEWSIVDAYQKLIQNGFIVDPAELDLLKVFQAHHLSHADALATATTALGGTACNQPNAKITADLIQPLIQTIGASGSNQAEDAKAFAHALESLAASTYQSVVASLSQPSLRRAAMSVGAVEARHAAVLAALLNPTELVGGGPARTTGPAVTAPTTTVVTGLPTTVLAATTTTAVSATLTAAESNKIVAIPTAFGSLAPIPLTVGASLEGVTRKSVNLETPSLNSYLYADEAC